MPINVMDAHYRSFQHEVVPVCLAKGISILGMKSLGGGFPQGHIPTRADVSSQDCIRYTLTQRVSSLVIGIMSMDHLKQNVDLARNFTPMLEAEQTALLDRVREAAGDGCYELFKTTQVFDGPYHRRQHRLDVTRA